VKHLRYATSEPPERVGVRFFCGEYLPVGLTREQRGRTYTTDPEEADCEKCLRVWRKHNETEVRLDYFGEIKIQ